jgi:hypothetical protein
MQRTKLIRMNINMFSQKIVDAGEKVRSIVHGQLQDYLQILPLSYVLIRMQTATKATACHGLDLSKERTTRKPGPHYPGPSVS